MISVNTLILALVSASLVVARPIEYRRTATAAAAVDGAAAASDQSGAIAAGTWSSTAEAPDFGSCSVPQITFANGLSAPTDLKSFNHGPAANVDVISEFICKQLKTSCQANQAAQGLCTNAQAGVDADSSVARGAAVQVDIFNHNFGIKTTFGVTAPAANVAAVITNEAATATGAAAAAPAASTDGAAAAPDQSAAADASAGIPTLAGTDFGSCSVPQITFAAGSFAPTDLKSFNHAPAQNADDITKFMCDQLATCKANQAAQDLCTEAQTVTDTVSGTAKAGTGVQADLFNHVFGIKTTFGAATPGASVAAVVTNEAAAATNAAAAASAASTDGAAAAPDQSAGAGAGDGIPTLAGTDFGSCSVPQITFTAGSFAPTDLKSFNHASSQNADDITKFMCDQLKSSCKANQAAQDLCTEAQVVTDTVSGTAKVGTGVQADLFNHVFGIKTTFGA